PDALATIVDGARERLRSEIAERREHLAAIDALAAEAPLIDVEVCEQPALPVITHADLVPVEDLPSAIRRGVQRLRRRVPAASTFVACFPLRTDDERVSMSVGAVVDPMTATETWSPQRVARATITAPPVLLPLAYDAVLSHVASCDLEPTGD